MKRRFDWRSRLNAVVERTMREPFAWGRNDCALFIGDIIEAITGDNPGAIFRGTYDTADGAMSALNAAGYTDLADFASHNFEEIHPSRARRGDIALIRDGERWVAGFFDHERIGSIALTGYATGDRERASRAFKVGD